VLAWLAAQYAQVQRFLAVGVYVAGVQRVCLRGGCLRGGCLRGGCLRGGCLRSNVSLQVPGCTAKAAVFRAGLAAWMDSDAVDADVACQLCHSRGYQG
jgi:hypothetical protein